MTRTQGKAGTLAALVAVLAVAAGCGKSVDEVNTPATTGGSDTAAATGTFHNRPSSLKIDSIRASASSLSATAFCSESVNSRLAFASSTFAVVATSNSCVRATEFEAIRSALINSHRASLCSTSCNRLQAAICVTCMVMICANCCNRRSSVGH